MASQSLIQKLFSSQKLREYGTVLSVNRNFGTVVVAALNGLKVQMQTTVAIGNLYEGDKVIYGLVSNSPTVLYKVRAALPNQGQILSLRSSRAIKKFHWDAADIAAEENLGYVVTEWEDKVQGHKLYGYWYSAPNPEIRLNEREGFPSVEMPAPNCDGYSPYLETEAPLESPMLFSSQTYFLVLDVLDDGCIYFKDLNISFYPGSSGVGLNYNVGSSSFYFGHDDAGYVYYDTPDVGVGITVTAFYANFLGYNPFLEVYINGTEFPQVGGSIDFGLLDKNSSFDVSDVAIEILDGPTTHILEVIGWDGLMHYNDFWGHYNYLMQKYRVGPYA